MNISLVVFFRRGLHGFHGYFIDVINGIQRLATRIIRDYSLA